ncbi:MAG: hypothetical protein FWE21_09745 [Defluviitaleaceae bacterium]|nr:hypothetical protein [Defluviitaleaceae bacterium]
MEQLINIRQSIIDVYKKFEVPINYSLKFILALFVFLHVARLGMYREEFSILFNGGTGVAFAVLFAIIFTVSPPALSLFFVAGLIAIQLSLVLEVAILVFLFLLLIIVFYARLAPKQTMLILAIVIGFNLNIPYAVVLFAGLYFGVAAIIPVVLGTAVWSFLPLFTELAQGVPVHAAEEFDFMELPGAFMDIFGQFYEIVTTNLAWVIVGFVFAMMILAVHLISLLSIKRAKDIALGVGAFIGLISMIMIVAVAEVDLTMLGIILGSIISVGIVYVAKFFDNVMDYARVERVKFDDEDNVYYVKIVPKVKAANRPQPTAPKIDDDSDDAPQIIRPRRANPYDYGQHSDDE